MEMSNDDELGTIQGRLDAYVAVVLDGEVGEKHAD